MSAYAPDFVIQRIYSKSLSKFIVPRSTPIPFFGNFNSASVYTIGINPSHQEFLSGLDQLLPANKKRLEDFDSLGIASIEEDNFLDEEQANRIFSSCIQYFQNNPYEWFNSIETTVNLPLNTSYFDGSACHLDLIQWATNPVWSGILKEDSRDAKYLLESDLPFLSQQIQWIKSNNQNLKCFVLSGKTVVQSLQELFDLRLSSRTKARAKVRQYSLYVGSFQGTPVYGTSMNIPDAYTSSSHREFFSDWLAQNEAKVL